MIYPFEKFNVDISCLGNHEVDHGIKHAVDLINHTSCPWMLSNLFEIENDMKPLCNLNPYHIMEHQGFKIGFLGFAEKQWLDQMPPEIDCSKLKWEDYNEVLQKLSKELK